MAAGGEKSELLRVVPELGPGGFRQGLCRDSGLVVASPQLVCAREMIERTPAFAFRKPQEPERAVRIVVLGLERACAAEALDSLPDLPKRSQRDCAIVVSRRIAGFDGDRPIKVTNGRKVISLCRCDNAKIVSCNRMAGRDPERFAVGNFGGVQLTRPLMRNRFSDSTLKCLVDRLGHHTLPPCLARA